MPEFLISCFAAWDSVDGFEGLLDGGDDAALGRELGSGNPRAGRRAMAAAAELRRDVADVHRVAFRAQADAGLPRLQFLEDAGDDDRFDGADVVNQAFGFVGDGAGLGEVSLLQPEVGDAVAVGEPEVAVNVFEQPGAGERVGLVNLVANRGEVRAAADEFAGDVVGARRGGGVLEGAGVGGDGGEEAVGNALGDGPRAALRSLKMSSPLDGSRPETQLMSPNRVLLA